MLRERPPEPWHSFFLDLDNVLVQPVELQCIGGFAIAMLHGLPRPTVDVDYLSAVPTGETATVESLAGMGSSLHNRHGVYVQHVGFVTVPDSYEDRLTPMFPSAYQRLRLLGLEAYDLALSKLERNSARDREDVRFLARAAHLDPSVLVDRYRSELRPYLAAAERHDLTIRLWIEMLGGK
jgi:hypothetical protein